MKSSFLVRVAAVISILTLSVSFAAGTSSNVSWVAPTTYNDGSPLNAADIDHYTLTWQPASGQVGPSGTLSIPGSALSAQVNVPCGSTTFTLSATTGAGARYPNATSSSTSGVPYASGVACAPNPPSGLVAQ